MICHMSILSTVTTCQKTDSLISPSSETSGSESLFISHLSLSRPRYLELARLMSKHVGETPTTIKSAPPTPTPSTTLSRPRQRPRRRLTSSSTPPRTTSCPPRTSRRLPTPGPTPAATSPRDGSFKHDVCTEGRRGLPKGLLQKQRRLPDLYTVL